MRWMFAARFVQKRRPTLAHDEVTTVRKNLETQSVDVSAEFVRTFRDLFSLI